MRVPRVSRVLLASLLLVSVGVGCLPSPFGGSQPPAATPTAAAAPTPAATAAPPTPVPTAAAPATPTLAQAPATAPAAAPARPEVAPSAQPSPAAGLAPPLPPGPLQIMDGGQPLTAAGLPTPETYYADLLAKYGKDFSPCFARPTPQPGTCPKPASLGTLDLKQQVNVELILDASGSMSDRVNGQVKIDVAKRVLTDFIGSLPKNANVALRVFGHKGSSSEADRALSCASSELLYPFQPLDSAKFQQAIQSFLPNGWTPLAASFDAARDDFARFDPASSSNFVYVVTDGLETCDGDPVASARALHSASVQPIINIVGFDVDPAATQQLQAAAEQGGGKFYEASTADQLNQLFKNTFDWDAWTAYYNCHYDVATNQFNTVYDMQTNSFNCTYDLATGEFNEIYDDATNRFNTLYDAATNTFNVYYDTHDSSALRSQASSQKDAIINRARTAKDYAINQERTRKDSIINAAQSAKTEVIGQAQAQRDQAIAEAAAQRRQATGR